MRMSWYVLYFPTVPSSPVSFFPIKLDLTPLKWTRDLFYVVQQFLRISFSTNLVLAFQSNWLSSVCSLRLFLSWGSTHHKQHICGSMHVHHFVQNETEQQQQVRHGCRERSNKLNEVTFQCKNLRESWSFRNENASSTTPNRRHTLTRVRLQLLFFF